MNRERGPLNLFHAAAAVEREKEETGKQHHVEMILEGQINIFEVESKNQMKEANRMQEQAIEKLRKEVASNKVNAYVQVIGEFLLQYVANNPNSAEKILDEKKTIVDSLNAMRKEAEKKKQSNVAVLTNEEGMAIVLRYFGITGNAKQSAAPTQTFAPTIQSTSEPIPAPTPKKRFEASLDDFL